VGDAMVVAMAMAMGDGDGRWAMGDGRLRGGRCGSRFHICAMSVRGPREEIATAGFVLEVSYFFFSPRAHLLVVVCCGFGVQ